MARITTRRAAEHHRWAARFTGGVVTPDRREWIKIIKKTSNEAYQICFDGFNPTDVQSEGWTETATGYPQDAFIEFRISRPPDEN
jgi:hypothetical protein